MPKASLHDDERTRARRSGWAAAIGVSALIHVVVIGASLPAWLNRVQDYDESEWEMPLESEMVFVEPDEIPPAVAVAEPEPEPEQPQPPETDREQVEDRDDESSEEQTEAPEEEDEEEEVVQEEEEEEEVEVVEQPPPPEEESMPSVFQPDPNREESPDAQYLATSDNRVDQETIAHVEEHIFGFEQEMELGGEPDEEEGVEDPVESETVE